MDNNSTPSLPDLVLPSVVTTLNLPSKHASTDMRLPRHGSYAPFPMKRTEAPPAEKSTMTPWSSVTFTTRKFLTTRTFERETLC